MTKLRMIHNMARSGSTLMCKCLGCMEHVVLLSELHPLGLNYFNPLKQAADWFGLVETKDILALKASGEVMYSDLIALIERRCAERGGLLVLRDWGHLDFTGIPFLTDPGYVPMLYEELRDRFEILRVATTRDPVAQWQSLIQLGIMREPLQSGALSLDQYLSGYRKYAELCVQIGFVRYEDLLEDPGKTMRDFCQRLEIPFDPGFIDKWHAYETITGDVKNPRTSNVIKMPPPRPIPPALREAFLANQDYRLACEMLGYPALDA